MAKSEKKKIFYYSRRKLGIYLLFNLGLLALAILFTWSIFPNYQPVYYFALTTCILSILSSLVVFMFRMPLAIITDSDIKIDHNQPLRWTQIKSVEKINVKCFGFDRYLLKITPQKLEHYHMTFMQRIAGNSQFGSFSIPLYAMSASKAKEIEKIIISYTSHLKTKPAPKKKKDTKKNSPSTTTRGK